MKKFLIPLAIVASSICVVVFCVFVHVGAFIVFARPHVRTEMQRENAKLQEARERLVAATTYKETAEQRLNRGDNEGVFRAKEEYEKQLSRIDERYSAASTTKFAPANRH